MEQHTLLQREESPRSPAAPSLRRLGGSRHITHWDPEDLGSIGPILRVQHLGVT